MFMLFGLLAVAAFQSGRMLTVHWIKGKIATIFNRTMCTLYKVYMRYMYISKSCVE